MIIKFKIGNKKKILLIFPMFFLFFNLISAAIDTKQVEDVFKINEIIQYAKPCINNGTYCSNSASCNFTFYGLDNSILVNNVPGTNIGANGSSLWAHNISYTESGIYKVDIICTDNGNSGAATFYNQVTGSGMNDTNWFYLIIIILSLGIITLGFYMSDPPITILGTFGLYFLGIYILFNGIAGVKDMVITWGAGIIMLGIASYISVRSAHELITN